MSRPYADSDAFQAIAHPVRREVLNLLRKGPMPAGELLGHFRMSWPTLTHHLRILRHAGLVTQQRKGRQRLYAANSKPLRSISTWLRTQQRST